MSDKSNGDRIPIQQLPEQRSPRLHERIIEDLKKNFPNSLIEAGTGEFRPDLIIRSGNRVALIEIKTGDPELPLPSSANVQMLILKDRVQKQLGNVVPVLVTNYSMDENDRHEMSAGGIEIIDIKGSTYDSKAVSKKLVEIFSESDSSPSR